MKAYITSASAISPQHSFQEDAYLSEIKSPEQAYFSAIEPTYREYIDPKLSRRMSRIIKMSVACAKQCLQSAEVQQLGAIQPGAIQPGAIIVGTSLGCLQDTEKFLAELLENQEGLLSPTSFIQSTHNTIAGQIALTLNCPQHNFTYVQRGHSFERALEDGLLQLQEGTQQVLVGGVDEVTPTLHQVLCKAGCAGNVSEPIPAHQKPTWGEGASFFLLDNEPSPNSMARIEGFQAFYHPRLGIDELEEKLNAFLKDCDIPLTNIDAVMMGMNGYEHDDAVYFALYRRFFPGKLLLSFKNLCGEYFTASAFGYQLAARILYRQEVFEAIRVKGDHERPIKNILFYNHSQGKYHTFSLLSACQPSS